MQKGIIKKMNEIYQVIYYKGLQKYIDENDNKYGIKVFKQEPATAMPKCITVELIGKTLRYEDLDRNDGKYNFRVNVQVFAQKQGNVLGREIAQHYEELVCDYLMSTGLTLLDSNPLPNMDTNIHRVMITCSGSYDSATNMIGRPY